MKWPKHNRVSEMEESGEHELEAGQAIEKLKQVTNKPDVLASVQALLSIVPYAGGPLSVVLGEYRSRRNQERILDTLEELGRDVEGLSAEKRDILSPDEVVEIVHKTLEEIAKTSSEEKLQYLRNSLTKAFTEDQIAYPEKELYLTTLKDLSLGELELMRETYMSGDPFVQTKSLDIDITPYGKQWTVLRLPPQYDISYTEPDTGETLREVVQQRLDHLSQGAIEGLIDSLDAKGLSRIKPNLEKRTVKIMTERPSETMHLATLPHQAGSAFLQISGEMARETPIEASRTAFGQGFIRYIESKR